MRGDYADIWNGPIPKAGVRSKTNAKSTKRSHRCQSGSRSGAARDDGGARRNQRGREPRNRQNEATKIGVEARISLVQALSDGSRFGTSHRWRGGTGRWWLWGIAGVGAGRRPLPVVAGIGKRPVFPPTPSHQRRPALRAAITIFPPGAILGHPSTTSSVPDFPPTLETLTRFARRCWKNAKHAFQTAFALGRVKVVG